MSPIALEFFGAPHIVRDGAPVHVTRRKALGLLVYLVLTQRPHSRDALAGLLWPELGQRRARANLRHSIYTLNDALGPGLLESVDGQVAVPMRPDLRVDVLRFRRLCAAPVAHHHTHPHLCEACIQSLANAANLYRGDFLAGFALPDSPEFDTWQLLQREALQRELSSTLDGLAHVYAEAGRRQYDLAIAYARRWLALDPLHEPAHRTLMRLYAESGERAAALRQYEECVRVLADELAVEPEAETFDLNAQIRAGLFAEHESHAVLGDEDAIPVVPSPAHNLPAQATTFIGRAREMEQIARRLADPDCRLLSIVGPGGSGKTRLAIQAAAAQAHCFRDGVRFVDLSPVESPNLLATAIERALDLPELGSADPRRRLCDFLGPKQMLLVLDNLEHLLDGVDLLPELLHAAPDLSLLVTSRERLNLREEWLSPLEGLSVPPGPSPGMPPPVPEIRPDLSDYDASLLFINRMRKLRPNFVPDAIDAIEDCDATAIGAICRLLGGMPLAIELAAGWTRTLTLPELQAEIQKSLDVLSSTLRDAPPRLRSMRAAFDHSWRLLSADERAVMRQFSVFRGGCTREAAKAVAGATAADLASLVDQSWLRLREGGRYTIHELARQYCAEKLEALDECAGVDPAGTPDAVRRRHCAYYGAYLDSFFRDCNYEPKTLGDILWEFSNLLAALQTAVAIHDLHTALTVSWSVFFVGDMMGWLYFSIQTLDTIVPVLEERLADACVVEPERTEVAHVLAGILHAQFSQYGQLGLLTEAGACNTRLRALAEAMQPGRSRVYWRALGLQEQVGFTQKCGDYSAALELGRDAPARFAAEEFICFLYGRERGVAFWQSDAFNNLGYIAWALGDYAASERYYGQSAALCEATGEQRFKGMNLGHRAWLAQIAGDYERAEKLAHEGLRLSEMYGDHIGAGMGHLAVGRIMAVQGRYDSAHRHLFKSLETGRQTGRIEIVMRPLCELGRIDLAQGKPADARHRFEDALAAFERIGASHINALTGVWLGLAWCALAEEDLVEARRLFEKAKGHRGATAFEIQVSQAGLAHVLLREGEQTQAEALLLSVIDHAATAHETRVLARRKLDGMRGMVER